MWERISKVSAELKVLMIERERSKSFILADKACTTIDQAARKAVMFHLNAKQLRRSPIGVVAILAMVDSHQLKPDQQTAWDNFCAMTGLTEDVVDFIHHLQGSWFYFTPLTLESNLSITTEELGERLTSIVSDEFQKVIPDFLNVWSKVTMEPTVQ